MDFLTTGRDETLSRLLKDLSALITATETIKHDEQIFQRYADCMIHVRDLLHKLQSHQESIDSFRFLQRLEPEIKKARQIIHRYKSKNPVFRPFVSSSVSSKLNQSSKEIHAVLQLLPFSQINTALTIKETADAIIRDMESMQVRIWSNTSAILSSLDLQQGSHGLFAFGRAKGIVCPLPVQMENRESEGEKSRLDSYKLLTPSSFFLCPLTGEVLEDPVMVSCDHSFERKAIEEYFDAGQKFCPICSSELSSIGRLELRSNSALRNFILEWKRREDENIAELNAKKKIMEAGAKLNLVDSMENANEVLGELHNLMMETPSCIGAVTESSCKVVPKLAELLKNNGSENVSMVMKCLLLIARFSDENKEIIGRRGVIKCLLEQSMKGEPNAVAVLLELSRNKVVAGKIGGISYSISILISLLDNPSSDVAEMAGMVLENLASIDISSTVVMAKFGHFTPFLEMFNSQELPDETRAHMAEELSQIQLTETSAKNLNNEQFITHITQMLSSDSPSTTMASLNSIKQFITFDEPKTRFLRDESAIPALLHLLKTKSMAEEAKQKALAILISLIQTAPPSNPAFKTLFSPDGVRGMINHIETSAPNDQVSLLHLLLTMVRISIAAAEWIVSDDDAMRYLFSAISMEQNSEVKINALNLIYSIAEHHHMVLLIPSSPPSVEAIVHSLVTILAENDKELPSSAAAGILIHLAPDDDGINKLLQSSALLKSIHTLIVPLRNSHYSAIENVLGVLLRCVNQSSLNLEFHKRVGELLRADLIRILSAGSSLAKQRAAVILSHLSRSIAGSSSARSSSLSSHFALRRLAYATRSAREGIVCPLHKPNCSSERIVCLVMDGAVKPLIEIVRTMEAGSTEAALMALDTMFGPSCDSDGAAAAIVESGGAAAILEALERGEPSVKEKALELFCKIRAHPDAEKELDRFKGLVLNMVRSRGVLKAENLMKHLLV